MLKALCAQKALEVILVCLFVIILWNLYWWVQSLFVTWMVEMAACYAHSVQCEMPLTLQSLTFPSPIRKFHPDAGILFIFFCGTIIYAAK
jgi:hypothetical protein